VTGQKNSKNKKDQEEEKNDVAWNALREAVAKLPKKPEEKLRLDALVFILMIFATGTLTLMLWFNSHVFINGKKIPLGEHITKKTGELLDYSFLSLSASLSVAKDQIDFLKR
jgi:hypothetical protein